MKPSGSNLVSRNSAILLLCLISLIALVGYGAFPASSSTASRESVSEQAAKAQKKSPLPQPPHAQVAGKPNAPSAVGITATLTDNTPQAAKVAPGSTISYTAVITSTGGVGQDATAVNFNAPLDANTTYAGGTVHASPIAFNDTYNWVGNTQLDTTARALSAVTANDVAVNATLPVPGADTFNLVTQTNAPTALAGGLVTLNANGSFVYTPPLGRPNSADGASVNDSFTYTITNSADPTLTATGTVTITLTGRVWYLQAGAAGDGRSNTPSSSPSAMSTAADKSADIFYIFSNASSLNGPFSLDAGQTLLGQGVNLIVNTITLFTAAAPTPTTTNTAGNAVTLAGAPGNNTLAGFNIGNSTGGTAIAGANVGTLTVSTMSINTNGAALDLTGVGAPTVSVVLGGTTSTGGARNVSLVGLNGTVTLAGGALSGATGNALNVDGGNAGITFSGTISNSGARQVNIINKTSGTVALSGAVSGAGTGIFLNANGASIINFTGGVVLSTGTNDAFTATSSGTITVTGATNTLTTTSGQALKVTSTTIAATGLTFQTISSNAGANNGITLDTTGSLGGLTVTGAAGSCTTGSPTCTGGTIQGKTGADGSTTSGVGIYLNSTLNPSLTRMSIQGNQNHGIRGNSVTGFTLDNSLVGSSSINGTSATADTDAAGFQGECSIRFFNLLGTATISNSTLDLGFNKTLAVVNNTGTLNRLTVTNCTVRNNQPASTVADSFLAQSAGSATLNFTVNGASIFNAVRGFHITTSATQTSTMDILINGGCAFSNTINPIPAGGGTQFGSSGTDSFVTVNIDGNSFRHGTGASPPGVNNVGRMMTIGVVSGNSKFDAKITNNTFGVTGIARSGSGDGADAIGIFASGNQGTTRVNGTTHSRFLVQNNVIKRYGEAGILINARQGNSILDATVFGNTINEPGTAALGAFAAIWVNAGALPPDTSRVDVVIGSASVAANKNTMQDSDPSNATDVFIDRSSCGGCASVLNLYRNGSGAAAGQSEAIDAQIITDDNNPSLNLLAGWTNGGGATIGTPGGAPPPPARPAEENAGEGPSVASQFGESTAAGNIEPANTSDISGSSNNAIPNSTLSAASEKPEPFQQRLRLASYADLRTNNFAYLEPFTPVIRNLDKAFPVFNSSNASTSNLVSVNYPMTAAVQKTSPSSPQSGETLNVPLGTLPAGKSITIKYSATVNVPPLAIQVSTQGTVSGSNFSSVLTDDPDAAGTANPTITLINTLMTWNGVTNTDWNTATNWTQPAGGTQYAPGVSNPAINDVVIPNVGNQPTIGTTDIGVFSLNIANGRTLSITSPRVLTIGGSPGGDLTLDGIISGGNLNLGAGAHVINNTGGTGSLSSTNVATVLSGSTVTLNNNLQAGALAVNAGGSMNITNRTLSLNGSGAALVIPGGATFTTTGSTVTFNGAAAQQAAGIAYNNLTDANTAAPLAVNTNASIGGTLTINANAVLTPAAAVIISGAGTLTGSGAVQVTRTAVTADFASQYTITNKTLTNLTVEYIGSAAQIVSALTYGGLKISNALGVTLAGNTTVNGLLNLAGGDITTAAFTLTQPSSAPASQGTGDIIGNAKRSNGGVLPTGTALTFGNPNVSINFASVTALTDVNINLVKSAPGAFTSAVQRTYTITPTGGGTFSATLRLHYLDSELNGNTEGAGLKLWRFNGVSLWTPFANTGFDTTANWAETSGVTLFSPWTLSSAAPTDVRLDAFTATGYDGGALIEWRTGFEVDNLGFNLYRDEGGKRVAVNSQMVAGSALAAGSGVTLRAGQAYAWWDGAASKSGAQYWLESIDLKGQSEWHGPFFSRLIGGSAPVRANSSMLGRGESTQAGLTLPVERVALPRTVAAGQIAAQSGLAGQPAVKMWVKREGFYRVTASELGEAGLDPRAETRLLQLYADGQQIPINVILDSDGLLSAIEFYGRGLDAAFTDQRAYWLVSASAPGLRINLVKGAGQPTVSQSFLYTAERRDRTIYFSGLRNGERENFFGAVIAASPVDQSLTLQHVDQTAVGSATIEVALQGVTTLPHKVWVYLNGAFAGEMSFDGQAGAVSRFNVAQSLLRSGDNQVRFVAQAGTTDISLVDYIRFSYWHSFTADDNALRLTTPGAQQVTIGGFTSNAIRVLDVTDPDAVQELRTKIEQHQSGFAVTVASPGAGERRLLAIDSTQTSKPAKIAANQPSSLRTTAHAADFVMIARREFFSAIEPLKTLRSNQGLKVELADIEDVFDEFSFGNKSPQAMKDFLQYATTSWKTKPRFVLLVGDASYDAKNYLGLGDSDLVPTKLIDTSLMETASDDWLADFNADGLADLAVGRLAARTSTEASLIVRKIISYENSAPLESMLLVADANIGFDFESAATQLRSLIPGNLRFEQINRGELGDATAKSRLIDAITRGQKVVNYMGHGSVNLWSGSLLTNEDAAGMTNGERLPVFVMMTCLNGYFHDPALDSLAESLLKAENGGAVAVWASTGMTEPPDQSVLNKQLYQLLFAGGGAMTLGEATMRAKAAITDGDIRRTWVLLGDPTMRLK